MTEHNYPTNIPFPTAHTRSYAPSQIALEWEDWVEKNIGHLDLAVVLKLPMFSIDSSQDYLRRKLSSTLNILDVAFMSQASRNHTNRIPRFVTTECDAGVGWHAHIAFRLQLPSYSILPDVFEAELRQRWGTMVGDTSQRFVEKETYVAPIRGRYVAYSAKADGHDFKQGCVEADLTQALTSLT
jgi:hypothetical protein